MSTPAAGVELAETDSVTGVAALLQPLVVCVTYTVIDPGPDVLNPNSVAVGFAGSAVVIVEVNPALLYHCNAVPVAVGGIIVEPTQ
jgi:hypothetical protein